MTDPRIEELEEALEDPRMTVEFAVICQGILALWDKLEEVFPQPSKETPE